MQWNSWPSGVDWVEMQIGDVGNRILIVPRLIVLLMMEKWWGWWIFIHTYVDTCMNHECWNWYSNDAWWMIISCNFWWMLWLCYLMFILGYSPEIQDRYPRFDTWIPNEFSRRASPRLGTCFYGVEALKNRHSWEGKLETWWLGGWC